MANLPRTVVVLPASGTGKRFGELVPKQFVPVCGKSLYIWTVELFQKLSWIEEIYLVVSTNNKDEVRNQITNDSSSFKVRVVEGSYTRHRSIQAGVLEAFRRKHHTRAEIVIVHDVVRPCVSKSLCERVAIMALTYGACGPVRPLVSTIVTMDSEDFMKDALPRAELRASEMPQAFKIEYISIAYQEISEEELDHGTECLLLARKYNPECRVKLLDWHEDLFKVTYERDLLSLKVLLEEQYGCSSK